MANISDAYGKITLVAKDEKTIDTLADIIRLIWGGQGDGYYTELYDETEREEELPEGVEGAEKTFNFQGCGRWDYAWNIDMFAERIREECLDDDKENMAWKGWGDHPEEIAGKWAGRKHKLRALWKQIKDEKWWALFDYKDEEAGGEYLYGGVALVSSDTTSKSGATIIREERYDYTPENLTMLGFYDDIEDARDTQREWGEV